jgi:hypothetical protein
MSGVFGSSKPAYQPQQENVASNLGGVADTAGAFGKKDSKSGYKSLKMVIDYLKPLVSGDRTAMTEALGPELGNIGRQFDSAKRNTAEFGPRGGGQAGELANLETQRASTIGDAYLKARPLAAGALTNIGSIMTGAGTSNFGAATGAYNSQGNQYSNLAQQIAQERARRSAAWGSLFSGIGSAAGGFLGGL